MSWKNNFPSSNRYCETDYGILYHDDCFNILKSIDDNTIDTVITDPPYGLSNHSESVIRKTMNEWLSGNDKFIPDSRGFMGKSWDAFVPPPALWKEVYRVMKPGATILVFAGTRTQDLMTMSLRLAGFEIKDTLMYMFGSGFPKATDISKQIDKMFGAERKVLCTNPNDRPNAPPQIVYTEKRRTSPITAPATPEAKLWEGYKSHSLKPAYEPIILAIKPNEGSYVQNALKWGVAGLNIDAGRIETDENLGHNNNARTGGTSYVVQRKTMRIDNSTGKGRFPANIILDEESAKMLDEQSGVSKSSPVGFKGVGWKHSGNTHDKMTMLSYQNTFNDKGGASRFFYTAKASRQERNLGCESLSFKKRSGKIMHSANNTSDTPSRGFERFEPQPMQNFHPTVKPLKLIEYLVKLTKMPSDNQIYLDPFIGSGTTALACENLNRRWIGIEMIEDYCNIAKHRIKYIEKQVEIKRKTNIDDWL